MDNDNVMIRARAGSERTLSVILEALDEVKAKDICQLDVRRLTDITDFMVIASGTSNRHVHAMAERVHEATRKKRLSAIGIEGDVQNDWVLIDYVDVVVHLMTPEVREFYNLEQLWNEHLGEAVEPK